MHRASRKGHRASLEKNYFKSIRKDNLGISPLKKDGILYTDTVEKTNILNQQFPGVSKFFL